MSHPVPGHHYDEILEHLLESLPDECADALMKWREKTLDRERVEALLYSKFKGEDPERNSATLKAMINSNSERYEAVLEELKAEAEYTRVYEKLLGVKKKASLRVAM